MKFIQNNVAKSALSKATKIGINAGAHYLFDKGSKMALNELHNVHKKLHESIQNIEIDNVCKVGSIFNGIRPIINNDNENIVFKHTSSFKKLGLSESTSMIYKTSFNTGKPTSKGVYEAGKDNIIDLKTLIDTERDYISSEKRKALTSLFGFNQRSFDLLLKDTFLSIKDFDFLYRNEKKTFQTNLANINYYGNIFWEHTNIRIKSETDYYSIRLKIHLVKILNPNVDIEKLIESTFNKELSLQEENKLPLGRQLSVPKKHGNFRCNVLTDLKCTLNLSDWFKDNAKIVKTFQKTLGPSDIWDFDFYLHYGPGVLLNRIHEEMSLKENHNHPSSYCFIVQSEGDPRASITRSEDGENFNGTGPGRFNYSFQRRLKFVKKAYENTTILTTRQFVRNDEDFEDMFFQEYFTPDREQRINVGITDLNVNRLENSKYKYQVRYGEGRLSLYIEPYLKSFAKNVDPDLSNFNKTKTDVIDLDYGNILGDDQTDLDPTRGRTIRGGKSGNDSRE